MFRKREIRMFKGIPRTEIYPLVAEYWSHQGFSVTQPAPYRLTGHSYHSRIGLRREVSVNLDQVGSDTHLDLQFHAKISDTGIIGGAVAAVVWLPLAVVGGGVSYLKYEEDAKHLMSEFWRWLEEALDARSQSAAGAAVDRAPEPEPRPAAPPTRTTTVGCPSCGALLPSTWQACPYCGTSFASTGPDREAAPDPP